MVDKQFIYMNDRSLNLCKELNENVNNNYFEVWHKKIPVKKFHDYCLNYN